MREPSEKLKSIYFERFADPSSIHIREHLITLKEYASRVNRVTEFGVENANSTAALLMGQPESLLCYDIQPCPYIRELTRYAGRTKLVFTQADVRVIPPIAETDLLFIDTDHWKGQLKEELRIHAASVKQWMILHDTETFWEKNPYDGRPGMKYAVEPFLRKNRQWKIAVQYTNNNGLMVLEKK